MLSDILPIKTALSARLLECLLRPVRGSGPKKHCKVAMFLGSNEIIELIEHQKYRGEFKTRPVLFTRKAFYKQSDS